MDILSHGLWGAIATGRNSKKDFLWAVFFGVLSDAFSFGFFWLGSWTGYFTRPDRSGGHPSMDQIPPVIHSLYNLSHSLAVFLIVFGLVWYFRKRPFWPLAAWGIHILVDIPTHSFRFFPTPFLWPISDFKVNGIAWGTPAVFFTNWALLLLVYSWFLISKYRKEKSP